MEKKGHLSGIEKKKMSKRRIREGYERRRGGDKKRSRKDKRKKGCAVKGSSELETFGIFFLQYCLVV